LKNILMESIESVPLIKKEYVLYVETLLNIRWLQKDEKIIQLYHEFILNLLASKSDFVGLCLSKVISCFVPTDDEIELWNNGEPTEELSNKLEMVHSLIKKLIEVFPMIPVALKKNIRKEIPYYRQSSYKVAAYIYSILNILDYCPVITYDVYELIFEK
jgi:RNA polymerase I-specific transcription initiation factor RRN3